MSIEGIWTTEFHSQFGWENAGVMILEGGRAVGGDRNYYSKGSYTDSGDSVEIKLSIQVYGTPRVLFGEAEEAFEIVLNGKQDENVIAGTFSRTDKPKLSLPFRATRRADLG